MNHLVATFVMSWLVVSPEMGHKLLANSFSLPAGFILTLLWLRIKRDQVGNDDRDMSHVRMPITVDAHFDDGQHGNPCAHR